MMVALDPRFARIVDRLDSRVLGAVRFVDAVTQRWVVSPLEVTAPPGAALLRNRSGAFVVTAAPGLEAHLTEFLAPPDPPPAFGARAITLTVRDPAGRYLPRQAQVPLPRDADPTAADGAAGSLFTPVMVPLYPGPAGAIYPGWAVLRVSVKRTGTEVGVPNAWLRLRLAGAPATDPPRAAGMADERGEALVAAVGIQITNWDADNGGAVLATDSAAVLDAYFDAGASSPPDPDVVDGRRATLPTASRDLRVASGRQDTVRLELTLP